MLEERFSLFYTGYALSLPQTYEHIEGLNEKYGQSAISESVKERLINRRDELRYQRQTALSVAESVGQALRLPVHPYQENETYLEWMEAFIRRVEDRYPMNQIGYYYFYYARMVTTLLGNVCLGTTRFYLYTNIKDPVLLQKGAENIRDCEFILFRLIAAAALISGEHGHRYFNTYYKELNQQYESLMSISWSELTNEQMVNELPALIKFEQFAKNGFEECFVTIRKLLK